MGDSFRFKTWHAAAFLAAVSAASAVSSGKNARRHWRSFRPPAMRPPAWAFPSVRGGLNALQLWADLRILNNPRIADRNTLLGLRAVSWGLYALFAQGASPARGPLAAPAVTFAEGVTAGATVALLARSDRLAAAALAPLALWTAYTSLLHGEAAAGRPDSLVDRLRWQGAF